MNITIYNEVTAVPLLRILTPDECRERLFGCTKEQARMWEYWSKQPADLRAQLAYYSFADNRVYMRLKREMRVLS